MRAGGWKGSGEDQGGSEKDRAWAGGRRLESSLSQIWLAAHDVTDMLVNLRGRLRSCRVSIDGITRKVLRTLFITWMVVDSNKGLG